MDFIAFDLETTGIQPKTDAIVEIGAVRFRGAVPAETFCTLINPGRPIPPEASAPISTTASFFGCIPVVSKSNAMKSMWSLILNVPDGLKAWRGFIKRV